MPEPIRPPIPATCESRPTLGGVVIPWVNVQLADGGVDFRSQHESRTQRCYNETLCQVCGTPIAQPPIVFIGGPRHVAALQFNEPPLHPECAVYVSRACPMVAGRMEYFASRDVISNGDRGKRCPDPGCDCGGWVGPTKDEAEAGGPAHDWYAVYVSGYALGISVDRPDRVHSGVVAAHQVLAVRHVSTPGSGRTWVRVPLELANQEAMGA